MNIAEKLAREIARVAIIKEHYAEIERQGDDRIVVAPAILLMRIALDEAFAAAGSNDALQVIVALKELEGFTE